MKVIIISEKSMELLFERFLDKIANSKHSSRGAEVGDGALIPQREVHYFAVKLLEDLKESGLL